jgi:hypothetical protein
MKWFNFLIDFSHSLGVASQLQKLEQKKSTISRENFWLNEISDVVAVLKDPGLLSLKSSF